MLTRGEVGAGGPFPDPSSMQTLILSGQVALLDSRDSASQCAAIWAQSRLCLPPSHWLGSCSRLLPESSH